MYVISLGVLPSRKPVTSDLPGVAGFLVCGCLSQGDRDGRNKAEHLSYLGRDRLWPYFGR